MGNDTCEEFFTTKFTEFNYWSMVLSWLMIPVSFFGIIGNILIIKTRVKRQMKSPVNLLMIALAFADGGMLLFAAVAILPMGLYDYYSFGDVQWPQLEIYTIYAVRFLYPVALMFHTASIYVLALITVERYIALCHPFRALSLCSSRNAKISLVLVTVFSIAYNVPRFFEYDLKFVNGSSQILAGPVKQYFGGAYARVYEMWLYLIIMFALPFFLMVLFNFRIVCELRNSRNRRRSMGMDMDVGEHSTTIMLCIVTFIFLLANTLTFVLRIYYVTFCERILAKLAQYEHLSLSKLTEISEFAQTYPSDILGFLLSLSSILVAISSAINFPIYYVFSERFRLTFKQDLDKHFGFHWFFYQAVTDT